MLILATSLGAFFEKQTFKPLSLLKLDYAPITRAVFFRLQSLKLYYTACSVLKNIDFHKARLSTKYCFFSL